MRPRRRARVHELDKPCSTFFHFLHRNARSRILVKEARHQVQKKELRREKDDLSALCATKPLCSWEELCFCDLNSTITRGDLNLFTLAFFGQLV